MPSCHKNWGGTKSFVLKSRLISNEALKKIHGTNEITEEGAARLNNTVWKSKDFTLIEILREINFEGKIKRNKKWQFLLLLNLSFDFTLN